MTDLTVPAVPEEVHRALRERAVRHGRSTEAEARAILQDTVQPDLPPSEIKKGRGIVEALVAWAREVELTDEEIDAMQKSIDESRTEARRLYRPVEFE